MKQFGLFIAILIATYGTTTAQDQGARIKFASDLHSFGKIMEEGGKVSHDFEFMNVGTEPLKIKQVIASCGCTTPDWTRKEVAPGEKGFIRATFDPYGRPGVFQKNVTVISNAVNDPRSMLTIEGEVTPRPRTIADIYPMSIGNLRLKNLNIVFDTVYDQIVDTSQIVIYNNADGPMTIEEVETPSHIWTEGFPRKYKQGQPYKIRFFYSPEARLHQKKEYGYVFDEIYLITNDPKEPRKKLHVVANIQPTVSPMGPRQKANAPMIAVQDKVYDFGEVKEGEIVTHEYEIRNNGKSNLEILDAGSACKCISIEVNQTELAPGEVATVRVSFNTLAKPGPQVQNITIFSNDPRHPRSFLRIKGVVHKNEKYY